MSEIRGPVLITGGCGFIGSAVVRRLRARFPAETLLVLDRLDACASLKNLPADTIRLCDGAQNTAGGHAPLGADAAAQAEAQAARRGKGPTTAPQQPPTAPLRLRPEPRGLTAVEPQAAHAAARAASPATTPATTPAKTSKEAQRAPTAKRNGGGAAAQAPTQADAGDATHAGRPAKRAKGGAAAETLAAGVYFVRGDVCEVALVEALLRRYGVRTVLHFAAQTHVDNSFETGMDFTRSNVLGTHAALEAARVGPCCAAPLDCHCRPFRVSPLLTPSLLRSPVSFFSPALPNTTSGAATTSPSLSTSAPTRSTARRGRASAASSASTSRRSSPQTRMQLQRPPQR